MRAHRINVSVVVPSYREAENLRAVVPRIAAALVQANVSGEIIVVDDNSQDGTDSVCAELAQAFPLRLITRYAERGLASAVIHGLREATGDVFIVMDADLSHPPEAIPAMVTACQSPSVDFVIGSRYVRGGSVSRSWSTYRRLNSRMASLLARGLTTARDPMAGFFALRRSRFQAVDELRPIGYKIGLELIVRCDCRRIVEVPIHFVDRVSGQSKLTMTQQWQYLRHLARLYWAKYVMSPAMSRPSGLEAGTDVKSVSTPKADHRHRPAA